MKNVLIKAAALAALFTSAAWAGPTAQLVGGSTTVTLDASFLGALVATDIAPAPISPGELDGEAGTIRYPIPIGALDVETLGALDVETLEGEIMHTGGLTLTQGDTQVALQNFIIDTTNGILTGVISLNGDIVDGTRFPLFDLDLGRADLTLFPNGFIRVLDVNADLTAEAAALLNEVFGLGDALTDDTVVGWAAVRTAIWQQIGE
jgi:hypothetical protein